jgi:hypothetical protein
VRRLKGGYADLQAVCSEHRVVGKPTNLRLSVRARALAPDPAFSHGGKPASLAEMPEEGRTYRGGRPALPAPPVVVDVPDDPDVSGLLKLSELVGGDPPLSKFVLEVPKPPLVAIPPPPKPSRSWA